MPAALGWAYSQSSIKGAIFIYPLALRNKQTKNNSPPLHAVSCLWDFAMSSALTAWWTPIDPSIPLSGSALTYISSLSSEYSPVLDKWLIWNFSIYLILHYMTVGSQGSSWQMTEPNQLGKARVMGEGVRERKGGKVGAGLCGWPVQNKTSILWIIHSFIQQMSLPSFST